MYNTNKLTILLVDDDADLIQYWSAQLARVFKQIRCSGHSFDALESLHKQLPDIIFADVDLPEMDGFSLAEEIKNNPAFSSIPVVLYKSGYLTEQDKREAARSGADQIVSKPLSVDEISGVARECYSRQQLKHVMNDDAVARSVPRVSSENSGYADFLTQQLGDTIQQLKKEQQVLSLALDRFKDFAYTVGDYFWEVDAEMCLVFLGTGVNSRLALPLSDYQGKSFVEYFYNSMSIAGLQEFQVQFTRRQPIDMSSELDQEQNLRIVKVQGQPYYSNDGLFGGYRGAIIDITDSQLNSEKLYFAAHHDALTGLLNTRAFTSSLKNAMQMLQDDQQHVLCYIDLDYFKEVNDSAGHRAGDELLIELSDLFRSKVRSNDMLARIGGDEFAILLKHCNLDQARRLIQDLHTSVKTYRFECDGRCFEIGLSIGLLEILRSELTVSEVMDLADQACYAAKKSGRNQIRVYGDDHSSGTLSGDAYWLEKFHVAVNTNQLCLFQQPMQHFKKSKDVSAYEVLVRMKDGDRLVPPDSFLSVIQRFQLSPILDRWVVNKLLDYVESAVLAGSLPGEFYSVNISAESICDLDFKDHLQKRLKNSPRVAERICFEVTESSAMENLGKAIKFISELRVLGCRFALDDFGTGFSSLSHLKNLPVDFVKMDGVFVKGIISDPVDLGMVESIQHIATLMDIQTIAEYVENEAIAVKLREIGVDYLQGFHVGHPELMPALPMMPPSSTGLLQ
ncbi:MAG TPA: EAL domain-containing protein [Gammaproteobacteria bacterium]|nr:EAL domain-containing protein [Gammaproteobacteria bacterium]